MAPYRATSATLTKVLTPLLTLSLVLAVGACFFDASGLSANADLTLPPPDGPGQETAADSITDRGNADSVQIDAVQPDTKTIDDASVREGYLVWPTGLTWAKPSSFGSIKLVP